MTQKKRLRTEGFSIRKLNRSEFIRRVSNKTGFCITDVKDVVSAMESVMQDYLSQPDYECGREVTVMSGLTVGTYIRKPTLYYNFRERRTKTSDYRIKVYADIAGTLDSKLVEMWRDKNEGGVPPDEVIVD